MWIVVLGYVYASKNKTKPKHMRNLRKEMERNQNVGMESKRNLRRVRRGTNKVASVPKHTQMQKHAANG